MFCRYCGTKLTEQAVFCHACGKATAVHPVEQPVQPAPPVQPVYQQPVAPVPPAQPVYQQPVAPVPPAQPVYQQPVAPAPPAQPVYQQPVRSAADAARESKLQTQALVFGILGLSLSFLGIPGIIFSAIASGKASEYKKRVGRLSGKAKTGYKLAKAGKIIGIILGIIWTMALPSFLSNLISSFDNPFEYFAF